jgi:hypothetical protein
MWWFTIYGKFHRWRDIPGIIWRKIKRGEVEVKAGKE